MPGPVRHVFELPGLEIVDVDVLRQAALVALPGAEVPEDAGVGDLLAIRAVAQEAAAIEGHRLRQAARDRHREQACRSRCSRPRAATETRCWLESGVQVTTMLFGPQRSGASVGDVGSECQPLARPRPPTGMTYTSRLPWYSPVKAIQRPSGENRGMTSRPSSAVSRVGSAARARHRPQIVVSDEDDGVSVQSGIAHEGAARRIGALRGECRQPRATERHPERRASTPDHTVDSL